MSVTLTTMSEALQSPQAAAAWIQNGWEKLVSDIPLILGRMAAAALLIVVGILLLKLGKKLLNRLYRSRTTGEKKNPIRVRQSKTLHSLLMSVFTYVMYFVIALTTLSALGVNVSSFLTVAGIGGVAIGFGCQTLVQDVVSGLFLWTDGYINVGDVVTVAGQTGTIEKISLRTTALRSVNGNLYVVPNGDIRTVVNMTADFRNAVVDLPVNHGHDLNRMLEVLQEEMNQLQKRLELKKTPEVVGVIGSTRFSATIRILCGCKAEEVWALEREIRLACLNRLNREGLMP